MKRQSKLNRILLIILYRGRFNDFFYKLLNPHQPLIMWMIFSTRAHPTCATT